MSDRENKEENTGENEESGFVFNSNPSDIAGSSGENSENKTGKEGRSQEATEGLHSSGVEGSTSQSDLDSFERSNRPSKGNNLTGNSQSGVESNEQRSSNGEVFDESPYEKGYAGSTTTDSQKNEGVNKSNTPEADAQKNTPVQGEQTDFKPNPNTGYEQNESTVDDPPVEAQTKSRGTQSNGKTETEYTQRPSPISGETRDTGPDATDEYSSLEGISSTSDTRRVPEDEADNWSTDTDNQANGDTFTGDDSEELSAGDTRGSDFLLGGTNRSVRTYASLVFEYTKKAQKRIGKMSSQLYIEFGIETWAASVGGFGLAVFLFVFYPLQFVLPAVMAAGVGGVITLLSTAPIAWIGWSTSIKRERVLNIEKATPLTAAESFPHINDSSREVRGKAAKTVASVAQEGPGKIVRESSLSINEMFELLIEATQSTGNVAVASADALMYFSRDYPGESYEYEDELYQLLTDNDNGPVSARIGVAVANEAANRNAVTDEHIMAVTSLVDSHDPEARKYAAIALGLLGTEQAVTELHRLSSDTTPEVRKEAQRALDSLEKTQQ